MARIRWSKRADDALATIVLDRRQRVGFVAARTLRQRITDRVHLLRNFPELGRRRSDNEEGRELIVSPYIISYQIVGETVVILDVFHARGAIPDGDEDKHPSETRN